MCEYQNYYENFKTGYWADEDPEQCRCRGGGWALSEVDTWHKCPIHFDDQLHPEDEDGNFDAQQADPLRAVCLFPEDTEDCLTLAAWDSLLEMKFRVADDEIPF